MRVKTRKGRQVSLLAAVTLTSLMTTGAAQAAGKPNIVFSLTDNLGYGEWFGIPRTTDESLCPSASGWSPDIVPPEKMMEGKKGRKCRELKVYNVE